MPDEHNSFGVAGFNLSNVWLLSSVALNSAFRAGYSLLIRTPHWLTRSLDVITQIALVIAAGACALCTFAPWGIATLFRNLIVHIPGAVYPDGMYVAAAAGVAVLIRRSRLIGIAAALVCFWAVNQAAADVPKTIIKALAGAQGTLFPVNSILDQAHLPDLNVGIYNLPPACYLDYGLGWTMIAAQCLLVVSVLGLAFDPVIVAFWIRFGALPCPRCRKWLPARRKADYCTRCGFWLPRTPEPLRCRACRTIMNARDNYCAICGMAAAFLPGEAVSL